MVPVKSYFVVIAFVSVLGMSLGCGKVGVPGKDGVDGINGTNGTNATVPNDSRVKAHRGSALTATSATWTTLVFDIVSNDPLSEYNSSTGVFTPTQTGVYSISAVFLTESVAWVSGNHCGIGIFIGNTMATYTRSVMPTATVYCGAEISTNLYLTTGQSVTVRLYHDRGSNTGLHAADSSYNNVNISLIRL
ncbi:MAG: hypothetical protein AABZ06_15110 [Bdellovibrionota bacterium]